MTIVKWLGGLVAALVLVLILAIIIIPRVVDPNDFRDKITSVVKQETGRDLLLAGDLSVSVFPWLGIKTQALSLSQPEEIGGDMISVQTAQIRVKLMPLLGSRLEIDTVILEEPKVRLITLKNGISSFTGLVDDTAPTGEAAAGAESTEDASTAIALVIQGLELTNGNLLWDDRQAGQSYEVRNLNLITGNLLGDDFAQLSASGEIIDSASPDAIGFELNGEARIDTDTLQVTARDLTTGIKQGAQSLGLTLANLVVDQKDGISVTDLALDVTTVIKDEASGAEQAVALKALLPEFLFNTVSGEIAANGVDVSGGYGKRDFSLAIPKVAANMQQQTAAIDLLSVKSADLNLSLSKLKVTQFIDKPSASGLLNLQPFNVASLLKDLDIDYVPADKNALQSVGFKTSFKGGMQSAALNNLELTLDQSKLSGSVALTDLTNLAVVFDLVLDKLNLDSYLPVTDETAAEEATSSAEALAVPMAALKGINAKGSFKAQQLISGGLQLNDIDVQIKSTPTTLTITPKANLYEGSIGGEIVFSDIDGVASLHLNNKVDLVNLLPLLTAADVTDQLSGIGTLGIDVVIRERDGVQSNEGTIKLLARDGAIKGIDIKKMIDGAYAKYNSLKGRSQTEQAAEGKSANNDETGFAEVLGTFYLKDNRLTNDDFELKAPLFRVSGSGVIDLAADSLNYLVKVSVVNSSSGQGGASIEELAGLTIPIRLKGSLAAPSYAIDMKALMGGVAKKKLKGKKDQYLKDKLGITSLTVKDGEEESDSKDSDKKDLKKKLLKGLFNK